MKEIDKLLEDWESSEKRFLELKSKRDEIERKIMTIMRDNMWKDYISESKIHASISEIENKEIDQVQLSILLPKRDIESVTKYSTERRLIIVTPDGKERIRKMIKVGR